MAEEPIWKGTSSQLKNLGAFILCGVLSPLVIPIFIALWKWLEVKNHEFELTTERLLTRSGIFSKTTESLELYRVRDLRVTQPFWQRIFGLENIELSTTDETTPLVVLDHMPAASGLSRAFREQVEKCRMAKRVREIDIE